MTWSYDGEPQLVVKDEVRLLVGDTNEDAPLLQDEEIEYLLTMYPKPSGRPAYLAAAAACEAIANLFGRSVDRSVGPISRSDSQKFDHYTQLAAQYRIAHATGGRGRSGLAAIPVLGGGGPTTLWRVPDGR